MTQDKLLNIMAAWYCTCKLENQWPNCIGPVLSDKKTYEGEIWFLCTGKLQNWIVAGLLLATLR